MKTKKIKARKMWGSTTVTPTVVLFITKDSGLAFNGSRITQFYVLPADAESVADMISQVATALCAAQRTEGMTMNGAACLALAAIGIKGGAR